MWDVLAGAAGNISSNITTNLVWEPQPTHRGTFGILSTCFVTLALCTWKIVHLNLPGVCPDDDLPYTAWWKPNLGLGEGVVRKVGWKHRVTHILGGHALTRRIGWLLIGLFAPELIAFAAFEQYWDVQSLQKFMEQVYVQQDEETKMTTATNNWWPSTVWNRSGNISPDVERDEPERPPWTLTHSWYAIMGGYSYNLREGSKVYLPDDHGRQRVVLKDEALRFIAVHEPSVIPRLAEATILDKSGAGTFVKIIALFQALWFSLQCIARMGQGLSISLLELTTFAHAVVALIIGWLWLKKPLDISEPDPLVIPSDDDDEVEVEGEYAHWLLAMLYTLSSFDGDEADEDKWRKLTPGQTERLQQVGATQEPTTKDNVEPPVYLQPVGDHGPLSFAELGWDPKQHASSGTSRPNTSSASRPATAITAAPAPRSPLALAVIPSRSPAQSLSELIQSAADAEHRLRIRMELAQRGWEHYILNAPRSPSPTTPATVTSPSTNLLDNSGDKSQQEEQEEDEDPHILQRNLKRTLRNTLVDRVHNFPRGHHQPTTHQYQSSHNHHQHHNHQHHTSDLQHQPEETQAHATTTTATATEQRRHTVRTHLGITLAGFLYGGLHLLAWDATFTSPAERTLWRIAALSLAASGLLVPVSHAEGYIGEAVRPWLAMDEEDRDAEEAAHLREKAQEILHGGSSNTEEEGGHRTRRQKPVKWRKWTWKVYRWCFLWMIEVIRILRVAVLVFIGLIYFGLRLFVFLECLVNLVHLPASAYEVVQWSQYVPHIS